MLITRECDYAVRIVRALSKGGKTRVQDICEVEKVPQPYAYKILKKLESHELVNGFRGASGGYSLAQELKDLSLYDIYAAIEGESPINACLQEGFDCPRKNVDGEPCKVHLKFDDLQTMIVQSLKDTPLTDLF